jgi:hypothetical protein
MTGKGQIETEVFPIHKTSGFLSLMEYINPCFFVSKAESEKHYYLNVTSKLPDWFLTKNTEFLALVDGNRFKFDGRIQDYRTQIFGQNVGCLEDLIVEINLEFLKEVAEGQTIRLRLGGSDFDLPSEIKSDIAELLNADQLQSN